jgi:hypothetical protein
MAKIMMAALALTLVANTYAQDKKEETIEGNGKLVTRSVPVQSFSSLKASGVYQLELSQGNTEGVKIEADENLQDLFEVHNDGSKLVIEMKKLDHKNLKVHDKMKVYVTFKKLTNMELRTVGNVSSENTLSFDDLEVNNHSVGHVDLNLTANKLDLRNTSVGNIKLTGKAQDAVVRNSGVGTLHAGDFVVQSMNIQNSGVGSAEVNAEKDLKIRDSMLGKVRNKGNAKVRRMRTVTI